MDEVAPQRNRQRVDVGDHGLALEAGHGGSNLVNAPVDLAFETLRLLVAHRGVAHRATLATAELDPPSRLAAVLPRHRDYEVRVAALAYNESGVRRIRDEEPHETAHRVHKESEKTAPL
jgi:hypothetical protein